jgi:hypothetical protein
MKIVEVLQNGGYIWLAAGHPYLAHVEKERVKSASIHGKAFTALKEHKIIVLDSTTNRWVLG